MAINNDTALPSNHAPLSVEFKFPCSLESLIQRAEDLFGHAHENNQLNKESMCRRPRKAQTNKHDDIVSCLATLEQPDFHEDINIYTKQYVNILYDCLPDMTHDCPQGANIQLNRWSKLLKENDYKGI